MKKITILLSSYNGERYIEEQINSLLSQKGCSVDLLVRDDGSTDSTMDILEAYQQRGLLRWYTGPNLGPAASFMNLIASAPESEYYALCDQDDYWMEDKLSSAVSMLENAGRAALYFSQTTLADCKLNPIRTMKINPSCTMGEALIAFYATGCTFVFNNALRRELLKYSPSYISMHDNWIYRVCLAVNGELHFDPESHILYRQHSNNVIGLNMSWRKRLELRFSSAMNGKRERSRTAAELLEGYGERMSVQNRELVKLAARCHSSFTDRVKLVMKRELRCASWKCNITSRLAILMGVY